MLCQEVTCFSKIKSGVNGKMDAILSWSVVTWECVPAPSASTWENSMPSFLPSLHRLKGMMLCRSGLLLPSPSNHYLSDCITNLLRPPSELSQRQQRPFLCSESASCSEGRTGRGTLKKGGSITTWTVSIIHKISYVDKFTYIIN